MVSSNRHLLHATRAFQAGRYDRCRQEAEIARKEAELAKIIADKELQEAMRELRLRVGEKADK